MNQEDYIYNAPARIVEFFEKTQTATVKICVEWIHRNANEGLMLQEYGELYNVPVHVTQGGGFSHTFPISAGDTCKLEFSQVGYDHWFKRDLDKAGTLSGKPAPHLQRRFSLDDGYCLVGYSTIPRCIQSYSASDSEWRNSDRSQVITLEAGGNINITTTGDVTTNCITSTVNCSESVVNATTSTDIVSPLTTVTGNAVITGTLAVNGLTTLGGGFTASAPSAGTNNISGDPTINGGVYSEHEHAGDGGDNETGTTGGVL